jgi:hypothetical protein
LCGWIFKWIDGRMDGYTDGKADGQIGEKVGKQMDGKMYIFVETWMDRPLEMWMLGWFYK